MSTLGGASALGSRDFRFLLSGIVVSALGTAMAPVALAFAVLQLGGSATQLGLVVASLAGAEVITLLFGGILGDRLPRQLLMTGSSVGLALTQSLTAYALLTGRGEIWLLAAVGFVNGCLAALARPASNAVTSLTVTDAQLPSAVAIRRLSQQLALMAGFGLGGIIVAATSPGLAILIDAATYAVAAICFARIRAAMPARGEQPSRLLADLADGAGEVLRRTWLWVLIAQAMLYHLLYSGVQGVLGPIVIVERGWDEAMWGWTLACMTIGLMLGGLAALRWRPRFGLRTGLVTLIFTATFPLALAVADHWPLVLAGAALHGIGLEFFSINWDLAIQQNVPADKLARVYAFDMVGSFVCRPIGMAAVGAVVALTGTSTWLLVVTAIIGGSAAAALAVPSVRRLERRDRAMAPSAAV